MSKEKLESGVPRGNLTTSEENELKRVGTGLHDALFDMVSTGSDDQAATAVRLLVGRLSMDSLILSPDDLQKRVNSLVAICKKRKLLQHMRDSMLVSTPALDKAVKKAEASA